MHRIDTHIDSDPHGVFRGAKDEDASVNDDGVFEEHFDYDKLYEAVRHIEAEKVQLDFFVDKTVKAKDITKEETLPLSLRAAKGKNKFRGMPSSISRNIYTSICWCVRGK